MATEGKRSSTSHRTPAQIRNSYKTYHGKPEQIKKRAQRNAARAGVKKRLGAAAVAGKDVGHKKPIRQGGSNTAKNLAVQSVKKNRGHGSSPGGRGKKS